MRWNARDYICAAVGIALGLFLMATFELGWWMPAATTLATFTALEIVR